MYSNFYITIGGRFLHTSNSNPVTPGVLICIVLRVPIKSLQDLSVKGSDRVFNCNKISGRWELVIYLHNRLLLSGSEAKKDGGSTVRKSKYYTTKWFSSPGLNIWNFNYLVLSQFDLIYSLARENPLRKRPYEGPDAGILGGASPKKKCVLSHIPQLGYNLSTSWPAGPMARRLTTNQEIAGSIPASVKFFGFRAFFLPRCRPRSGQNNRWTRCIVGSRLVRSSGS